MVLDYLIYHASKKIILENTGSEWELLDGRTMMVCKLQMWTMAKVTRSFYV